MPDLQRPLDFSYLIGMGGDDPVFFLEFLETFIIQTPLSIREMDAALVKGNWNKVADFAHKIKPTFIYIGRDDVKELVHAIEYNARNKVFLAKIPTDIEQLKCLLLQVYEQLEIAKKEIQSRL